MGAGWGKRQIYNYYMTIYYFGFGDIYCVLYLNSGGFLMGNKNVLCIIRGLRLVSYMGKGNNIFGINCGKLG